jgi:hypothetical protein
VLAKQAQNTPPVYFVLVILQVGSCEVFTWLASSLEPSNISSSQVVTITGMSHWCLTFSFKF